MRLVHMGTCFIEGRPRRGLGLVVGTEEGATTLQYAGGDKIATITDRTVNGFTLTLHPYTRGFGAASHSNRINAILEATAGKDTLRRYTAFQRWGRIRIWDLRLYLEMTLRKTDIIFTVKDGEVALDYAALESAHLTGEQPKAIKANYATKNSGEAINNIMALVAAL